MARIEVEFPSHWNAMGEMIGLDWVYPPKDARAYVFNLSVDLDSTHCDAKIFTMGNKKKLNGSSRNTGLPWDYIQQEFNQTGNHRTYFDAKELVKSIGPHSGSCKARYLNGHQDGSFCGDWENTSAVTRETRYKRFHNVAGQLEMPRYHRKEAYRLYRQIDHSTTGLEHGVVAFAAFALVCAVVDQRNWLHETQPDVENPEEYKNALDDDDPDSPNSGPFKDTIREFGYTVNEVKSAYKMLRYRCTPPYGSPKKHPTVVELEKKKERARREKEEKPGQYWPWGHLKEPEEMGDVNLID